MADDVMAVDERLARLEVTVAKGFAELGGHMGRLEVRIDRLEGRIDRLESRMDGLESRMDGLDARMGRLEGRTDALNAKLDVAVEVLSGKMQLLLEHMDAHIHEMRVTTGAIVNEHRADRRLMYAMLGDHRVRIDALEKGTPASLGGAPGQEA